MKISFEDNDGILQENGLPKIVVVNVDGTRFPYETNKTISELYQAIQKIKGVQPVVPEKRPVEAPKRETLDDIIEDVLYPESKVIQIGDIVTFDPLDIEGFKSNSNGQIVAGGHYRYLGTIPGEGGIHYIIDDSSPKPIRTGVDFSDLVLFRKTPKIHSVKKELYEMMVDCPNCKDKAMRPLLVAIVAEKESDHYEGKCEDCGEVITRPYPTPALQGAIG